MSLQSLTTGSPALFERYTIASSNFGRLEELTANGSFDGLIQSMSASESSKYDAAGQRVMHRIFCSVDPSVSVKQYIKRGTEWYRVLAFDTDGRPNQPPLLWVIDVEEHDARGVPSDG